MFRIDDATAATTLPAPETAGAEGYFTEGNPAAGTPATNVRGSWLNMIQEELCSILAAAGLTHSKTTYNQVLLAIQRVIQSTVVLTDSGVANAYAAVNPVPLVAGTWVDGVIQAVKIAHTNTGASTYAPDGLTAVPIYGLGLQPLQGGELVLNGIAILMHTTIPAVNSGNPIAVLMECAGGTQQVAPATQSNQAVNLGQFVSNMVGNGYIKLPNGLMIQWGTTSGALSSGPLTVPFPIAFPSAAFVVCLGATSVGGNGCFPTIDGSTISASSFPYSVWNTGGSRVAGLGSGFIAIGR